jgi:PAP2 superfamily
MAVKSEASTSVLAEHRLFLGVVAAYLAAAVLVDRAGLVPGFARTVTYVWPYLAAPAIAWIPIVGTFILDRLAIRDSAGRRINGLAGWIATYHGGTVSRQRIARLAMLTFVTPIFLNTFGWWKGAIPVLHPFALDAALASVDRWLHLGRQPWEWLQPLLGRRESTHAIDVAYWLWVLIVPCAILWQGWSRDVRTQRQFFLAFALTWMLLGSGLATLLSSAGPCFYEAVVGRPGPYADLLRYLDSVPYDRHALFARMTQDILWQNYLRAPGNPFVRISAMPSVHIATCMLYVLAARRSGRTLTFLAGGYLLVILVGSVHLGWHYAVDGYVSMVLTPLIWLVCGRLLEGRQGSGRLSVKPSGVEQPEPVS